LPRAVKAGADVLARCQAVRVRHDGRTVQGVEARAVDPDMHTACGEIVVEAPRVCLAGSATGTPALLLRSRVPDPSGETGEHLRIHPAVVAAGEFDEPVRAWEGIPQTYECTELLQLDREDGHRVWIVPAFAHPVGTAALVPGHGASHRALMQRYAHFAVLTAMIHDRTRGRVRPDGDLRLAIDYWPEDDDRRELGLGLGACARLLFAAGARRVFLTSHPPRVLEKGASLDEVEAIPIARGTMEVSAVHPMGSVPMGNVPSAAVDDEGRHRALRGLWVSDGSLFPSSIGVPPQLSIYALGLHVGRAIARG
jgi:choline dehydrogenase-like flavoprotein